MNKFIKGKRYKFNKEKALEDMFLKINYDNGCAKYWVDDCDNKEVTILSETEGKIEGRVFDYEIIPSWCDEINE